MPLMVGNIVVLNSGSPPMTVKAITLPARSYANGSTLAACFMRWNSRLKCYRTSPTRRGRSE